MDEAASAEQPPVTVRANGLGELRIPPGVLAALAQEDLEALFADWLRTYVGPRAQDETVVLTVERGD